MPPSSTSPDRRRIVLTDDGPALVDGPIDLVTADGTVLHCDRFRVALCLCRRSAIYPLCDTSHRRTHRRESGSTDR
ncbi:iron-binding protein [Nocardia mangyaensis]|uniref:Iron-binding protein n=1 Tax=Nocardia mangyaensis TaxID=2213200 RepID=A0A1J0W256_9NOCA|nr:iron-binding protein [Nocardia mangyaensis]